MGERVVDAVRNHTHVGSASGGVSGWAATTAGEWLDEGEKWAARVGRRYGIWGFEKRGSSPDESHSNPTNHEVGVKVAGDVANAVFAYGLTKVRWTFIPFSSFLGSSDLLLGASIERVERE